MTDDNGDVFFSNNAYRMPNSFPFVIFPSTFAGGFTFNDTRNQSPTEDTQNATELPQNKIDDDVDDEENEDISKNDEQTEGSDEHGESIDEKNDLRISQPKYSQLLRELDFGEARMVDVTNILPNEIESSPNKLGSDENDLLNRISGDEKYQNLSSTHESVFSDKAEEQETLTNDRQPRMSTNDTNDNRIFKAAANEIENDLKDLAQMIDQISVDNESTQKNHDLDESDQNNFPLPRKSLHDEDDDTSKQATQNYDSNENDREDAPVSVKSSRIPRLINQRSTDNQKEFVPSTAKVDPRTQTNSNGKRMPQQTHPMNWTSLYQGPEKSAASVVEKPKETVPEPNKNVQPARLSSADKKPQERIDISAKKQEKDHRFRQLINSPSSSDTSSVVEHESYQNGTIPNIDSISSPGNPLEIPKQETMSHLPPGTFRQDSQGTLIDENLDDFSSQIKQVLIDPERQTSTKEERTTDGIISMSIPLSTPEQFEEDAMENERNVQVPEMVFRRIRDPNEEMFHPQRQKLYPFQHQVPQHEQEQQHHHHRRRRRSDRATAEKSGQSSPSKKRSHRHHHHHHHRHQSSRHVEQEQDSNLRQTDDNWLVMLEKLEREHRDRLEKQQHQYECQIQSLEEKMQRRFDEYLTLTSGFQEPRIENTADPHRSPRRFNAVPIDSNIGRYQGHSSRSSERPAVNELIRQYYPADSTLNILSSEKKEKRRSMEVPGPSSRDETQPFRTDLTAPRNEKIGDLKYHYENKIDELKNQLKRMKMGQSAGSTRQSIETIERINSDNIRLNDEVLDLRHSMKSTQDENIMLRRQLDELREQIMNKDLELKSYHRTIAELEEQLNEAENIKDRQEESVRHAERQFSLSREQNEKIKDDLNLCRDRLLRLEERYREQEIENQMLRREIIQLEKERIRLKTRSTDDLKANSIVSGNVPTSRDYGRFSLTTNRDSSAGRNRSNDNQTEFDKYQMIPTNDGSFRAARSPRSTNRITDYLNEKPLFPNAYVAPTRNVVSPRRSSPNRRRYEKRPSPDRPTKHSDHLEQKLEQLNRKKHDLESRLSRIPTRNLSSTDRQLCDLLDREIDRVDKQIGGIRLELRKLNILRTH